MFPDFDEETTRPGGPFGFKIFFGVIGVIVIVFIVLHLAGGGFGNHGH